MNTICYCIYCSKHPLYAQRNTLPSLTGWEVGDIILNKYKKSGVKVSCLEPESEMIEDLHINPNEHEFPITAYSDGISWTGYEDDWYMVKAICGNEDYLGE